MFTVCHMHRHLIAEVKWYTGRASIDSGRGLAHGKLDTEKKTRDRCCPVSSSLCPVFHVLTLAMTSYCMNAICAHVHVNTLIYAWVNVCADVYMFEHVCASTHACLCTCTCVHLSHICADTSAMCVKRALSVAQAYWVECSLLLAWNTCGGHIWTAADCNMEISPIFAGFTSTCFLCEACSS